MIEANFWMKNEEQMTPQTTVELTQGMLWYVTLTLNLTCWAVTSTVIQPQYVLASILGIVSMVKYLCQFVITFSFILGLLQLSSYFYSTAF